MITTMGEKTIVDLKRILSTCGLPEWLVSDNRAQFTSEQQFLRENGIKHVLSASYHPSTNNEAKIFVQTIEKWNKSS